MTVVGGILFAGIGVGLVLDLGGAATFPLIDAGPRSAALRAAQTNSPASTATAAQPAIAASQPHWIDGRTPTRPARRLSVA